MTLDKLKNHAYAIAGLLGLLSVAVVAPEQVRDMAREFGVMFTLAICVLFVVIKPLLNMLIRHYDRQAERFDRMATAVESLAQGQVDIRTDFQGLRQDFKELSNCQRETNRLLRAASETPEKGVRVPPGAER